MYSKPRPRRRRAIPGLAQSTLLRRGMAGYYPPTSRPTPISSEPAWVGTSNNQQEVLHVSNIEQSIEVQVPVRTAYNQWTQFEEFPRFMEGVNEVKQLDDVTLHWMTEIGGQKRESTPRSPSRSLIRESLGPLLAVTWNRVG